VGNRGSAGWIGSVGWVDEAAQGHNFVHPPDRFQMTRTGATTSLYTASPAPPIVIRRAGEEWKEGGLIGASPSENAQCHGA